MTIEPPPRNVPATSLFQRIDVLVAIFVCIWGVWIAVLAAQTVVRFIGVAMAVISITAIPLNILRSRRMLDLLRSGEVADARIIR